MGSTTVVADLSGQFAISFQVYQGQKDWASAMQSGVGVDVEAGTELLLATGEPEPCSKLVLLAFKRSAMGASERWQSIC
jgi:hypothetical protein